jgi:hypothetical protein
MIISSSNQVLARKQVRIVLGMYLDGAIGTIDLAVHALHALFGVSDYRPLGYVVPLDDVYEAGLEAGLTPGAELVVDNDRVHSHTLLRALSL